MKIAIFGAGAVGSNVAKLLTEEDNDITMIDIDEKALDWINKNLDVKVIHGNAADPAVLESFDDVRDVELVLAVTDRDDTNIVACQLVHTMLKRADYVSPYMIARLRNPAYLEHPDYFGKGENKSQIPIDLIISPELLVTQQIMRMIDYPWATQFVEFCGGAVQLAAIRALGGGNLVDHEIRDLRQYLPDWVDTRVAAVYRGEEDIVPTANTTILEGDEVFFIAERQRIHDVIQVFRQIEEPASNKVVLIGAGNIGMELARLLDEGGYSVKLIERDKNRADYAACELPNSIIVINNDGTLQNVLEQADIESAEICCAVTNQDEANIVSSIVAKREGAKRTIALINNIVYAEFLDRATEIKIDAVISPSLITVSELLLHRRAQMWERSYSLRRGGAEAVEVIARPTAAVVGQAIGDLDLPEGVSVGAILRGEEVVIAHKGISIQIDDHVVLFVVHKDRKDMSRLEKLFAVGIEF